MERVEWTLDPGTVRTTYYGPGDRTYYFSYFMRAGNKKRGKTNNLLKVRRVTK